MNDQRELTKKVANILTLRYDPNGPITIPKLSWSDFLEYPEIGSTIEPMLGNVVQKIIGESRKVGMGLSGGIDTSVTLAVMRDLYPDLNIRTYCVSFGEDTTEQALASHVAGVYHTKHSQVIVDEPFRDLAEQVKIVNEPRWNLYASHLFKKAAEDQCDILVTGDGADELFGGYTFRYEMLWNKALDPFTYLSAHQRDWVPDQEKMIKGFSWACIYNCLRPWFSNPLEPLGQVFLADYHGKLMYDFMPTAVAFSKKYKIPVNSPFLEPEMIYAASHLPYGLKYDPINKIGKLVLRSILMGHSGFKPAIGGKIGFGMNFPEMWGTHIRAMCEETLLEGRPECSKFINRDWIPTGFAKAEHGDVRYIIKMLGLLAVEYYLRQIK